MKLQDLHKQGKIEEQQDPKRLESEPPRYKTVHQPKPCADCNIICIDRRIMHRHYNTVQNKKRQAHWKTYCSSCKLYLNPETGKFDSTRTDLEVILLRVFSQ